MNRATPIRKEHIDEIDTQCPPDRSGSGLGVVVLPESGEVAALAMPFAIYR